jgi:Flp pilus assembly CpaE family ATPase
MTEQLDVLLIEDQAEAAVLVQRMLARVESPSIRAEWVDTLAKGLARLETAAFDAILLDLNLPDSTGLQTFSKLREHKGDAALIVLTALEDEEVALSAVREGADEYLIKGDVSGPTLARLLRYAVERSRSKAEEATPARRQARILGFIGVKGGTGTTTVVLNVAAALARQNKSTIAVEMKPGFGLFSYQLKHTPTTNLSSLCSLVASRIDTTEVGSRLCSFPHELRVLFGPQKPDEFGEIDPATAEVVIRTVSQMAEYTVIDLPPLAFPVSPVVIRQCHYVAMVLERDPMSVDATKVLLEVLHSWGISQQITGAIVVNRTMTYAPMPINDISSQLGCPIFGVVPPALELCAKANQAGSPVVFLDPESTFSTTLAEMAKRFSAETVRPMPR